MASFVERDIVSREQADMMIESIETRSIRFISVVTIIGALLTGLGIMLYIASNWDHISEFAKVGILLVSMGGFYIAGIWSEPKYQNTSKGLIYISILIYGGGLFLIDQIFNLNFEISDHFILWILGVLPMVFIFKDYLMYIFVQALSVIFTVILFSEGNDFTFQRFGVMLLITIGIIAILLVLNERDFKSKISAFLNNSLIVGLILYIYSWTDLNPFIQVGLVFLFGFLLLYKPLIGKFAPRINLVQGIIIIGVTGLIYTNENIWEELKFIKDGTWFSVGFAIIFALYLLWLTRKGHITSLVFICGLIFRYYFDQFYDFLPKSIFFIIGGVILLIFGFYLERLARKKGGLLNVEKDR